MTYPNKTLVWTFQAEQSQLIQQLTLRYLDLANMSVLAS